MQIISKKTGWLEYSEAIFVFEISGFAQKLRPDADFKILKIYIPTKVVKLSLNL